MSKKTLFFIITILCITLISCSEKKSKTTPLSEHELKSLFRIKTIEFAKSISWAEKQLIRGGVIDHQFKRYFTSKDIEMKISEFRYKVISDDDIKKKKTYYYKSIQQLTDLNNKKASSVLTKSNRHPHITNQRILVKKYTITWALENNNWFIEKIE